MNNFKQAMINKSNNVDFSAFEDYNEALESRNDVIKKAWDLHHRSVAEKDPKSEQDKFKAEAIKAMNDWRKYAVKGELYFNETYTIRHFELIAVCLSTVKEEERSPELYQVWKIADSVKGAKNGYTHTENKFKNLYSFKNFRELVGNDYDLLDLYPVFTRAIQAIDNDVNGKSGAQA